MSSLSFRGRLALTVSALIITIAAAIWIYLPRKLEEEALALITHKAETLAQLTAFTIQPAIYFRDTSALDEALSGTRQDKDVAYVLVTDAQGKRLAAFHSERATARGLARRQAGGSVSGDGLLYELMMPIPDRELESARLYIGMSLARMNAAIVEMRIAIGLLTAAILAAGLFAAFLISDVLTRPLRDVAAGAQRITNGDLSHRVPRGHNDEIGQLATSFNTMAKRVLSIQEEERVRIAREVHDELGQALTSLKIDLRQLDANDDSLREIARKIDEMVDLVRKIAFDLRPAILDDLGVTAALEQQLRRLRESTGIETSLVVEEEPHLDMLTGATLYRIAQEGLANVVRHSQATSVEVALSIRDGSAVLEIKDNGRGMTQDEIDRSTSLGIRGMRERAELLGGSVKIDGRRGEGTVLIVTLPLAKDDHASSLR